MVNDDLIICIYCGIIIDTYRNGNSRKIYRPCNECKGKEE
jgi:hypothetical protein